ncbi:MAG: putative lipid II flippase FtsW [Acidimicrobiia bacterium]
MSTTATRLPGGIKVPERLSGLRRGWTKAGTQRTSTYLLLLMVIAVLNVIGVVMVLSASSVQSLDSKGTAWWFFERQLLWTGLGVAGFAVASRVDYRSWRRYTVPFLAVATALLVLVLIPGFGLWVDGSRRWLGFGTWRIQPSEIAKLALLVFAADVLTRQQRVLGDWRKALRPVMLVFIVFACLIMKEPDLASTMVLTVILGAVLVVGGIRARHLAVIGGAAVAGVTLFALMVPWRRARMLTFLDPWHDKSNAGYQVTQSIIALGSGGWTGVGLGASRAKWRFLPAAHTDFIFAIVGEELGLFGCLLVIGLFAALAYLGVRTAVRAPDRFGMLLAGGITAWIVGQAVINIGSVVGLLPVSGIPLPFVSFGGTALLFTMIAAGLLGNVARQGGR